MTHCSPFCPFVRNCARCTYRGGSPNGDEGSPNGKVASAANAPASTGIDRGRGPTELTGRTPQ